ncbi:RDD family protein [Haloarcula onubensis]|uniref:RDD family protein n=1 Tax=Haloarcula onubensis TaxID=2950539 RepID=A0ABU2FPY5_9EURY|nr:RDD family protein [Halomicroarcula sp. S3CR25-11]MDS0282341.1 RDD family protein [Halomicroarcula sp. S3CR25-11]
MADAPRTLYIAAWDDRFLAWLVDVVLVGAIVASIATATGLRSAVFDPITYAPPTVGGNGLALFVYWTALEGYQGQSAGKLVVDVAVTDERGDPIGYGTAAVESFGKAFLLPLDVIIGVLAYEEEGLRLFNKLSSTIVVETADTETQPEGVEYVYPSEK